MRHKNSNISLQNIARELNAEAVVEGKVPRAMNRIHFPVEIVKTETTNLLWSGACEHSLDGIMTMQGEAARIPGVRRRR
jgi:TolB-like protein